MCIQNHVNFAEYAHLILANGNSLSVVPKSEINVNICLEKAAVFVGVLDYFPSVALIISPLTFDPPSILAMPKNVRTFVFFGDRPATYMYLLA